MHHSSQTVRTNQVKIIRLERRNEDIDFDIWMRSDRAGQHTRPADAVVFGKLLESGVAKAIYPGVSDVPTDEVRVGGRISHEGTDGRAHPGLGRIAAALLPY